MPIAKRDYLALSNVRWKSFEKSLTAAILQEFSISSSKNVVYICQFQII